MTHDQVFALLEQAVVAGERCPKSKPYGPLNGSAIPDLIKAGKIRSEVSMGNWRVVTILVGPHAGAQTAPSPHKRVAQRAQPSAPRDYSRGA